MKRVFWHIAARFYQARSERAYARFMSFRKKAEKFFRRVGVED